MQVIDHKNSALTICQRFFIEKSIELLYMGSIDSYRVKLNNPKSILEELKYCLQEFEISRIKHFHTIKAKEPKKAIVNEALSLLSTEPNYLAFESISLKYLKQLLKTMDEHNYKKVISCIELISQENAMYLQTVINGIETLLRNDSHIHSELEKLDLSLNTLYSELINIGFSKGFLYKLTYGVFVNSLTHGRDFYDHFNNFKQRILDQPVTHEVIFRIDTTQKVYDAISAISNPDLTLSDAIDDITLKSKGSTELSTFNTKAQARKFIRYKITATDYLAALKGARSSLSEYLDVINLGLSDEFLQIHNRALVIDSRSPERGDFQHNVNILDGKYRVAQDHYSEFSRKLPAILSEDSISAESKEKIKSAIRYLRLGNQSTEVEHKFINYWIGLEYLFSNYESQNTIIRIKEHFINAHTLAYVKRNVHNLKKGLTQLSSHHLSLIPSFTADNKGCWTERTIYDEITTNLQNDFSLLAYRAKKLTDWFFKGAQPNATDYLRKHRENLEIHFTRIYRLRNEIIHDAATNTNNEQIASNLRYYLTFILNELIDFLFKNMGNNVSIENYFILNEIMVGNIEYNGYLLADLMDVDCSIDFMS